MKMVLRRISYDKYDDYVNEADSDFFNKKKEILSKLESDSDDVLIKGNTIETDLDVNRYNKAYEDALASGGSNVMSQLDVLISEYLYNDFKNASVTIPTYILYQKEVWSYLNLRVFFDFIDKRFKVSSLTGEQLVKRIKRVYFCNGGAIDRTGLRWLWVFADKTYDNGFELTRLGKDYIDPVKAIHESTIGKNSTFFKAFINAIKLTGPDPRIRNKKNKTRVPNHIRNLATMIDFESFESFDELSKKLAEEIEKIMI